MAKIGLKHIVFAPLLEDESEVTYGTGAVLAKALTADISITSSNVKLFANDVDVESEQSFQNGTISYGIDDLYDDAKVKLLSYIEGDVVDADTGARELTAKGGAVNPYVGTGFYGKVRRNGKNYWRAVWLRKVQFSEPADNTATKGETVAFQTPTLPGNILLDATEAWKNEATFSTEASCIAWLNAKANIVAKAAPVTSSVAGGTYTTAQNVTLTTREAGGSIRYTVNGTIPSATNGETYSTAIALAKPSNTCIKAVCIAADKANSDILELYIEVTA